MNSARICLCFSVHRSGEDPWPLTAETRINEVPYSKQFRIWWRKLWMKVESFHSGIGLGLNLCELYTGSYRQQRVYRDKQTSALTGRTWTPPGLVLQESSNIVTQSVDLISGYTPSSVSMAGRHCWHLIRKVWTTKPSESAQAVHFLLTVGDTSSNFG
jgi:hypothetical protein